MRTVVSRETGYARNASESAFPQLWNGLVGWWCPSIHARGGTRLLDLSTRANNGSFTGLTAADGWLVSGGYGAIQFPVSGSRVDCGTLPGFSGDCTWSIWFRHTAAGSDQCLMTTRNILTGGSRNGIAAYLMNGGLDNVATEFVIGGTRWTAIISSVNTANGVWRCLIGRRLNGQSVATLYGPTGGLLGYSTATAAGSSTSTITHEVPLTIGAWQDYAVNRFTVAIDDCRIWNRGLTDAECRLVARQRGIGLNLAAKRRKAVSEAALFSAAWASRGNSIIGGGIC
jgi:hypothetical protein